MLVALANERCEPTTVGIWPFWDECMHPLLLVGGVLVGSALRQRRVCPRLRRTATRRRRRRRARAVTSISPMQAKIAWSVVRAAMFQPEETVRSPNHQGEGCGR